MHQFTQKSTIPTSENQWPNGCCLSNALLQSSVGEVLDLNERGVRVLSRRLLNATLEISLHDGQHPQTIVSAEVRWIKRVGFDRYCAQLAFTGMDITKREAIRALIDTRAALTQSVQREGASAA